MSSNKRWPGWVLTRPGREQKIKKIVQEGFFILFIYLFLFIEIYLFFRNISISLAVFFDFYRNGIA